MSTNKSSVPSPTQRWIGFCGPGGTGKTTLASVLATRHSLPFHTSPARSVFSRWKITSEADQAQLTQHQQQQFQAEIFSSRVEMEKGCDHTLPAIFDRTLLDHLIYTILRCPSTYDDVFYRNTFSLTLNSLSRYEVIFYLSPRYGLWQNDSFRVEGVEGMEYAKRFEDVFFDLLRNINANIAFFIFNVHNIISFKHSALLVRDLNPRQLFELVKGREWRPSWGTCCKARG